LQMAASSDGPQAVSIDASDLAVLEVETNKDLIEQVKTTCGKFIPGRGLMNFQCLILCRRIFHNSRSGASVSTAACTRGIPDKPPKEGFPNEHGSVASFRNVLPAVVTKLHGYDPELVTNIEQNFRSAVWFGPWSEDEARFAIEGKVAPLRTERCFLMRSDDTMLARGVRVNVDPGLDLSGEMRQVPVVYPKVPAPVPETGKRKRKEERQMSTLRPVLETDEEVQTSEGQLTATIAMFSSDEWYKWNRAHTMVDVVGDCDVEEEKTAQADKLAALRMSVEMTQRLRAKGVRLANPWPLERSDVLTLFARDLHPRDYDLRKPAKHGAIPSVLKMEELPMVRGLAFRRVDLQFLTDEGLDAAEKEIQELEAAVGQTGLQGSEQGDTSAEGAD
jgi:hypothetical protein